MSDIHLFTLSPAQLVPAGDAEAYDLGRFDKRYLAQGDSWFSLGHVPFWATANLLQQTVLSRASAAVNCARPGVQLAHMTDTTREARFVDLLAGKGARPWDALLVSGGGNDLIAAALADPAADAARRVLLRADEWGPPGTPQRYLSEAGWETFTQHLGQVLAQLLDTRDRALNAGIPLLLHTYDYVTPRDAPAGLGLGPWLYKAMHDRYGIPSADWNALADILIDRLATLWLGLAQAHAERRVLVVDSRGTLRRATPGSSGADGGWENEIHPTSQGYAALAGCWRAVLDELD